MRAIVIKRYGGPEVLAIAERPAPEPQPGQMVIEVKAARVFRFEEIQDAHRLMESNHANGKIVVTV